MFYNILYWSSWNEIYSIKLFISSVKFNVKTFHIVAWPSSALSLTSSGCGRLWSIGLEVLICLWYSQVLCIWENNIQQCFSVLVIFLHSSGWKELNTWSCAVFSSRSPYLNLSQGDKVCEFFHLLHLIWTFVCWLWDAHLRKTIYKSFQEHVLCKISCLTFLSLIWSFSPHSFPSSGRGCFLCIGCEES